MQPTLFDQFRTAASIDDVILYALGEFQARGHVLADRELALDRLHGAFLRAGELFGLGDLSDERVVAAMRTLGATVRELPPFVAKRPYRLLVPRPLCEKARASFEANKRRPEHRTPLEKTLPPVIR